jgi:mRNA-degrading endonuclease RelE of RelBE toxin-antitoxin system
MDKNQKFLKRLTAKEFELIQEVLEKLSVRDVEGLDIKKLVGYRDVFRVRVGSIRIIFLDTDSGIEILEISRRSEKTYEDY